MEPNSTSALDAALAPFGSTNFRADCVVDGVPARLVMNEREVAFARADGLSNVLRAPFGDVSAAASGDSGVVSVRIGADQVAITFPVASEGDRFLRVLRVRQEPTGARATRMPTPGPATKVRQKRVPAYEPDAGSSRLELWMQYTMWTSTLLLVFGWIYLAVTVILGLVFIFGDAGGFALLWLVLALGGCALPFCLGSLARMLVYRTALDAARR